MEISTNVQIPSQVRLLHKHTAGGRNNVEQSSGTWSRVGVAGDSSRGGVISFLPTSCKGKRRAGREGHALMVKNQRSTPTHVNNDCARLLGLVIPSNISPSPQPWSNVTTLRPDVVLLLLITELRVIWVRKLAPGIDA